MVCKAVFGKSKFESISIVGSDEAAVDFVVLGVREIKRGSVDNRV